MAAHPHATTPFEPAPAHPPLELTPARGQALVLGLFAAAIFAGATLVFLVQPMAARMVLPLFGGSQSVWTTSMVFFQAVLLAGYAYAHLSARLLKRAPYVQAVVLLLPLFALPIGQHLAAPPDGVPPSLWLVGVLAASIGAPFALVTTASPLLQHWFSHRATGRLVIRTSSTRPATPAACLRS